MKIVFFTLGYSDEVMKKLFFCWWKSDEINVGFHSEQKIIRYIICLIILFQLIICQGKLFGYLCGEEPKCA